MKFIFTTFVSIYSLTLLDSHALAAQQGELSTGTSVGQFTNTLGVPTVAQRKVQVLGVVDALIKRESELLTVNGAADKPGVKDNFCVVDTLNGAVKLTFTSPNGEQGWVAKDIEGKRMNYRLAMATTLNGPLRWIGPGEAITIAATTTVNGPELCASGNVTKGAGSVNEFVPNITYVDTVLITATPL